MPPLSLSLNKDQVILGREVCDVMIANDSSRAGTGSCAWPKAGWCRTWAAGTGPSSTASVRSMSCKRRPDHHGGVNLTFEAPGLRSARQVPSLYHLTITPGDLADPDTAVWKATAAPRSKSLTRDEQATPLAGKSPEPGCVLLSGGWAVPAWRRAFRRPSHQAD